jgi:hypothetical protein
MPAVEFEPTISAGERPQTYALDCAATETGKINMYIYIYISYNTETCLKETKQRLINFETGMRSSLQCLVLAMYNIMPLHIKIELPVRKQ